MLKWITAFALAIPPLAVALLTHQAIQRAWLPAIPWWDKLLIGSAAWLLALIWVGRHVRVTCGEWAPIPLVLAIGASFLVAFHMLSLAVRPDIQAGWQSLMDATWRRIPWWDRLVTFFVFWGPLLYLARKDRKTLRSNFATTTLCLMVWADLAIVDQSPLHEVGWAKPTVEAACVLSVVWAVWEAARWWGPASRGGRPVIDENDDGSPAG